MNLEVITPPAVEPVSLQEAKAHLRIDHTEEDALITDLVVAARQWCEEAAGVALVTQTLRLSLDGFPGGYAGVIELPRPPAASVTSIKYLDPEGQEQTLDAERYAVDVRARPATVRPAWGEVWPAARSPWPGAVEVVYVAGVAAGDVDRRAKQAIRLLVGHWFTHREEVSTERTPAKVQMAAEALLAQIWHGRFRGG